MIIKSRSNINAISLKTLTYLGLKLVPHPNPYKITWVDTTSIPTKERCQVPVEIASYKDVIWCDVVPMNGHLILGRPWLYDLDVTLYGRSNYCTFVLASILRSQKSLNQKHQPNPLPPNLSIFSLNESLGEKPP